MENDLKFARKPYHFGIHLAANFGDLKVKHNAALMEGSKFNEQEQLLAIISINILNSEQFQVLHLIIKI